MRYFTYIIESTKSDNWYYGHTDDIFRRIREHNSGQNISTKNKGLWNLIFVRPFETKVEATRFELKLKRLKNKGYIKKEFSEFFIKNLRGVAQPG